MPFDGREYTEIPIVSGYDWHPDAPASAVAVSDSLRSAYAVARLEHRLIGIQTYNTWHDTQRLVHANAAVSHNTSITDVAFFRAKIPAHATHVEFEAHYRVLNIFAAIAKHRAVVTYSGSDTGSNFTETIQQGTFIANGGDPYTPPSIGLYRTQGWVELTGSRPGNVCEVALQGYAHRFSNSSEAEAYQPCFYVAWWSVRS